jgi:argininosuccinate synthase
MTRANRIVLAYTGSANTTLAISWLRERYSAEVVTMTLDLNQRSGLDAVRDRALAAGAVRAHVIDACEELARDFIVPAVQAGAVSGEGRDTIAGLARPLIARHLVKLAQLERASKVAHGAAGEDARTFARLLAGEDGSLAVLAPVAEWPLSDADVTTYARAHRLPLVGLDAPVASRAAARLPDYPANVDVAFEQGVPVALNGVSLPIVELMSSVDTLAGAHGVGQAACAAALLQDAHRALQSSASSAAAHVTGIARLKLFKGHSEIVECRSSYARS